MNQFQLILCVLISFRLKHVLGQINMTTYRLMPPLYRFDNYDECLEKGQGVYCSVHIEIKSDESNPIWRQIESFSSDYKRHYSHDYLHYGVCVEQCAGIQREIDSLGDMEIQTPISRYRHKDIVEHSSKVFDSEDNRNYRLKYGNVLSACLNDKFKREYNLSVEIFVEQCEISPEFDGSKSHKIDILYLISYGVFGGLVVLTIFSSLFDLFLKKQQPESLPNFDFYTKKHQSQMYEILTAFSICRNYYSLILPSKLELHRELEFIDGIKGIGMYIVVAVHVFLMFMSGPVKNPEFFENNFYGKIPIVFIGFTAGIQIFFTIASFLLIVNFKTMQSVKPETDFMTSLSIWIKLVIKRFIRLMTSLGLAMLFSATFLPDLVAGPFAALITIPEKALCRKNWWMSLFALNNNHYLNESCLQQSWFISADVQLYTIFTMILIIISRHPKLKAPIYLTLIVLSSGIPAFVTYIRQISGFIFVYPDSYRSAFFRNMREFLESYLPFYTNLSGYTYGFIAGEIYLQMKKSKIDDKPNRIIAKITGIIAKKPATFSWLMLILVGSLGISINFGSWFMENDTTRTTYVDLLFAGFNRTFWSVISLCIILGLTLKLGWIFYDFLCNRMMQNLGRISFQVYLWHAIVMRFVFASLHDVTHISFLGPIMTFNAIYIIAQLVGFVMTLLFEYPSQILMKNIFGFLKVKTNTAKKTLKAKSS